MISVLTQDAKARVKKEYRMRFLTVALFLCATVACIMSISLLPTYFLAEAKKEGNQRQLEVAKKALAGRNTAQITKEAARFSAAHGALLYSLSQPAGAALTAGLLSQREGISLVRIEYSDSATKTVRLSGKAATRDALLAFKARLEALPQVSLADLPVSSLAKSTDIDFFLTVTFKDETP